MTASRASDELPVPLAAPTSCERRLQELASRSSQERERPALRVLQI